LRNASLSFAFDNFVINGEKAINILEKDCTDVPNYIFTAARAELYRVAAWKAELSNRHGAAVGYARRSIELWPIAFLYDFHAAITTLALFLPPKRRLQLTRWYRILQNQQ
jgi:hypothetical protein